MRYAIPLLLLLPGFASAQTKEMIEDIEQKLANHRTAKWVLGTGSPGRRVLPRAARPERRRRAAADAPRHQRRGAGAQVPRCPLLNTNKEKHAAFVLKCYDPKTGAFAEPGGKPDVAITSIGVMAAMELGIPKEKFAKAMDYLKENAKTFEEVRIGAAAVEAWGVKDCPFELETWVKIAATELGGRNRPERRPDGRASIGSCRMALRLAAGLEKRLDRMPALVAHQAGQRADGGWGKKGEKASDIESTYRVMRALHAAQGEAEGREEAAGVHRLAPQQGRRVRHQARRQVEHERRVLRDHRHEVAGRDGEEVTAGRAGSVSDRPRRSLHVRLACSHVALRFAPAAPSGPG